MRNIMGREEIEEQWLHIKYKERLKMSDKKIIKGEDIGKEIGSEWVIESDTIPSVILRRLSEKSALRKWIEEDYMIQHMSGMDVHYLEEGFKKAIEVAKEEEKRMLCSSFITSALKRFAGVKE